MVWGNGANCLVIYLTLLSFNWFSISEFGSTTLHIDYKGRSTSCCMYCIKPVLLSLNVSVSSWDGKIPPFLTFWANWVIGWSCYFSFKIVFSRAVSEGCARGGCEGNPNPLIVHFLWTAFATSNWKEIAGAVTHCHVYARKITSIHIWYPENTPF